MRKTNFLPAAIGLLLFFVGMAAGAVWDLQINRAVYSPSLPPAVWMESFGFYPLYLPAVLWVFTAALRTDKGSVRAACLVVCAGGAAGLWAYSAHELGKRGVPALTPCLVVWVVLAALGALYARAVRSGGPALGARLSFSMGAGFAYLAAQTVVVNVLKVIWARTRFDDMLAAGDFSQFTAWFQPFGNGGSSFPSGHTAAACGIFALIFVCDALPSWNRRRALVWTGCWTYVALMAVCRVVIGRHYMTDTLAAAFVMTLLLAAVRASAPYRKRLAALAPLDASPKR